MRNLLIFSLLLNFALAGVVAYGLIERNRASDAPQIQQIPPQPGEVASSVPQTAVEPAARETPPPTVPGTIQSWHDIESADFLEYISNLRRIGCPDETIADIIISEVNELYRGRLARLPDTQRPEFRYWETGTDWRRWLRPKLDPEAESVRRELEREKSELLRELLGPAYAAHDLPDRTTLRWETDPFWASLPPEKRGLVLDTKDRYETLIRELRQHRGSFMDADDHAQIAQWERERDQTLAILLTPDEYTELEMRFSGAAETLRRRLRGRFDAAEQEFRAIFAAQKEFQNFPPDDPQRKEVEDRLRKMLGEERYSEYTAATGRR